jgi:nucleoside-diphosphate-sugar epimerase
MSSGMRVVVTGGSGKVGVRAIQALKAAGHDVVNYDIRPSPDGVRTVPVQCADFGQVMGALSGIDGYGGPPDAVVHLAGIPGPVAPDHVVFENNTLSTYNVFSAAARLGIRRIVWGSSETLLLWSVTPEFAPLDESHPVRPGWSYALSKHLGESIAETFARWNPELVVASLRFSIVYDPSEYATLGSIQARTGFRKSNLWSYVDARDCGEACRLALENARPGHEAMIISAADTLMNTPTRTLLAEHVPGLPLRGELAEFGALLSSEKARRLIGYQPRYSWRDGAE